MKKTTDTIRLFTAIFLGIHAGLQLAKAIRETALDEVKDATVAKLADQIRKDVKESKT